MLPMVNEIYKGKERIRILFVRQQDDLLIFICMDKILAYPEIQSLQEFQEDIYYGNYVLETVETGTPILQMTEKQNAKTEERWSIIADYIKNEPSCYDPIARAYFVKEKSAELGYTKYTVNQVLYHYWSNGMTKYALVPKYQKRGGKDKEKTQGKIKLGRPPKYERENKGLVVTDEVLSHIRNVINFSYNKTRHVSLRQAYIELLDRFYIDQVSGKLADAYPTEMQFRYHAHKYINPVKRMGTRKFNKDLRGITGNSREEAMGPGDKYQIDATIADIGLVSARDHRTIIGRPTLYFVTDVFSRIISGFYVGLEHPSWQGAMMALLYTFCDKQMVCQKYGVSIETNEWPCYGLPKKILCDNGEMISAASNTIIKSLGMDLENAAAWRPDLKGIVEQSFHQLNLGTRSKVPGAVMPDSKERGSHDYRLDAALTIKEYTKIVILHILKYNSRIMKENPLYDNDALKDHVPPIPIDIWNWGIINRSGQLRKLSEEQIKIALLPRGTARVTEKGIKFKNMYYTCEKAVEQQWFSQVRIKKSWTCCIAYDPRDLNHIFILEFEIPELAEKTAAFHNAFEDWTEEDFELWRNEERAFRIKNEKEQLEKQSAYNRQIQETIKIAISSSKIVDLSAVTSVKGESIRAERAKEKESIRQEESFVQMVEDCQKVGHADFYENESDILSRMIQEIHKRKRDD